MLRHLGLADELARDAPRVHGHGGHCFGLGRDALVWIEQNVGPDDATLETGIGLSTLVFAASGATHDVIAPAPDERDEIREQARRRGIVLDRVRFHVGPSEHVLPTLAPRVLDLALIDGAHAFPYPVLDWWWIAPRLRVGGRLLVDDRDLPPVAMLLDHLNASPSWRVERALRRTALVQKLDDEPPTAWDGHLPLRTRLALLRARLALLRH